MQHASVGFALVIALVATLGLTPLVIRLARVVGAIDDPGDDRRVHEVPTPRLGGLAMMVAVVAATIICMDWSAGGRIWVLNAEQVAVVLGGCVAIALIGAWDDTHGLAWRPKLVGQLGVAVATIFLPLAGTATSIHQLVLPVRVIDPPFLHPVVLPLWLGMVLAALWMVALMNMMNFIDGVDGLAAGLGAITALTFAVVASSYLREGAAIFAAAVGGAALGFLPWNFGRAGARVFMGDAGSMLLGYALAVVSLQGVLKTAAAVSLVAPLALLAIPILDTTFVVAKRIKYRQPLSSADRWHLHHRMLNVGYSPRRVSVAFWLWALSLSALTLALRFVPYGTSASWSPRGLGMLAVFVLVAAAFTVYLAFTLEILKTRAVRDRNARAAAQASAQETPAGRAG